VLNTLEKTPLPSPAARAAEVIRPSVVRVTGYRAGKPGADDIEHGVGTGVVIVDKGVILTNLHVVQAADTIKVLFADGLEATASITGAQPENDLAVLQAHKIPDDLIPATMRSTHDLAPGDQVVAVGFPFGIGPSYSAGVISGLKRVFRSPEGKQQLTNLIQFDAAANPGNSGGLLYEVKKIIVGQDILLERLIVALLARGHILVEGVPGLAKTMAIKHPGRSYRRRIPSASSLPPTWFRPT
jgi:S1-C subfamily serine protease